MGKQSGGSAQPELETMNLVMKGMGQSVRSGRSRDQGSEAARLAEIEGKEAERRQRRENREAERELDEKQRKGRARSRALWGLSGVAMSGSPLAVQSGRRADDDKRMRSLLDEGSDRLDAAGESSRRKVREAERRADLRNGGSGSAATLLSMGSDIFKDDPLGYYFEE